ncbi:amidohydrolase [Geotoga petraea]|jgi:5-methylthioadenosine/S-adenosylhomocysteine deaminase|uniref:amidohydrolase n=1 Tax=Geotoga petraea TaxID=28234 RepID=UPI001F0DBA0C|nr:amidohydrolase [Geotoga petraea]MDK2945473.1 5-methylthioadenosine/S-adenosylhomocysteine deaminase [Geotoga sp.]
MKFLKYTIFKNPYILKSADSEIKIKSIVLKDDEIYEIMDFQDIPQEIIKQSKIIDLQDKLVLPGFINTHSHSVMSFFKGMADDVDFESWLYKNMLPREELLNEEMAYWGSLLSQMEMVKNGITSFADMYMFTDQIAKATIKTGMRAFISRGLASDNDEEWKRKIKENIDTIEKYNGFEDRIIIGFGPHAPYTVSEEHLKETAKLAEKYNTHIQIHLLESKNENYDLSYIEKTHIFDVPVIAAHCVHVSDEDIKILSKHEVTVSHNPSSNLKLGNGMMPMKQMLEENINITVGTDGSASNNSLNILKEIQLSSLYYKSKYKTDSIKNEEFLRMMWENGGFAFNQKIGRLDEDFKADLIVVNLNAPEFKPFDLQRLKSHILYSMNTSNIEATMVGGKWIYKDYEFVNIKEDEVYENFSECYKEMENSLNN